MTKDLRHYAGKAPPHLCMDGHEPIGCWSDSDDERCPLCRANDAREAWNEKFQSQCGETDKMLGRAFHAEMENRDLRALLQEWLNCRLTLADGDQYAAWRTEFTTRVVAALKDD